MNGSQNVKSVLCVIGNSDTHYDYYTNVDGPYKDSIRYNGTTRNLAVLCDSIGFRIPRELKI